MPTTKEQRRKYRNHHMNAIHPQFIETEGGKSFGFYGFNCRKPGEDGNYLDPLSRSGKVLMVLFAMFVIINATILLLLSSSNGGSTAKSGNGVLEYLGLGTGFLTLFLTGPIFLWGSMNTMGLSSRQKYLYMMAIVVVVLLVSCSAITMYANSFKKKSELTGEARWAVRGVCGAGIGVAVLSLITFYAQTDDQTKSHSISL